jgi:nucleoid-associated protein YgaU
VQFKWGKTWSFEGVITSLNQKFTLFLEDGVPVRATVTLSMMQSKDEASLAKQNPTSGGIGGDRVWTVTEGDTLGWIAHKEYGDTSLWRLIAEANHLEQVRQLTPGMALVIPNA